jgi:LDH2 family malate/lactate/ureidoglycolate dehydrogenase
MSARIHLSLPDAERLSHDALRGLGYDADEAAIITGHVLDAALCGYEYSGLAKLLTLPEHPRFALPRGPMKTVRETPSSVLYDAANNVGMIALHHATKAAIDKCTAQGFAVVGVTNTWYSGRAAFFVEQIAEAGFIAIHTCASPPLVAPLGGAAPVLGTNPIAFGLPAADGSVSFDMGTAAFMGTDLLLRQRLQQPLPEGVAIDAQGRPTTDATAALSGALLTFGGHKGYGLSFVVQALGVLASAGIEPAGEEGYVLIAFTPELLVSRNAFEGGVSELIDRIKATPRQPGIPEILIPSERAARVRNENRVRGLTIDQAVYDALRALALPTKRDRA